MAVAFEPTAAASPELVAAVETAVAELAPVPNPAVASDRNQP